MENRPNVRSRVGHQYLGFKLDAFRTPFSHQAFDTDDHAGFELRRPAADGEDAEVRGSIAKSKGIKPPAGYTKSAALCRAFLDEHAPMRNPRQGAEGPSGGTAGAPSIRGKPGQAGQRNGPAARPGRAADPEQGEAGPPRYGTDEQGLGTPLRIPYGNQGGGLQHGRQVRRGRLVCTARRGPSPAFAHGGGCSDAPSAVAHEGIHQAGREPRGPREGICGGVEVDWSRLTERILTRHASIRYVRP